MLCDDLDRWDGGREGGSEGGDVCIIWLIPAVYGRNQHNIVKIKNQKIIYLSFIM